MKSMTNALKKLLKTFGCECGQTDFPLLEWALNEAFNYAKYELNIFGDTLRELEPPILNLAAGEYLKAKKVLSPETFGAIGLSPAIKRIEVGDTNTEFNTDGSLTPEQRFDLLTEYLIKSAKNKLQGYRRPKW